MLDEPQYGMRHYSNGKPLSDRFLQAYRREVDRVREPRQAAKPVIWDTQRCSKCRR